MTRKFRFTLDLTVELKVKEEIDREEKKQKKETVLFKEFIKDHQAVLDFYKLWLLENFRIDTHHHAIARELCPRDESTIIKSVLKKTPPEVETYFMEILDSKDSSRLEELEDFYGLFERSERMEFNKASFVEIE